MPNTLECENGTINSVSVSGLGAGLRYIFSEGLERISAHGQYLIDRLIEGLANVPEVRLYGAKDRSKQVPIVSLPYRKST